MIFKYEYRNKLHEGNVTWELDNQYKVIDCEICGFKHIVPFPTEESLNDFYSEAYFEKDRENYFNQVKEEINWLNFTYENFYELIEKHMNPLGGGAEKKLLEIGSGHGHFLFMGKEKGWNVLGFEPSKIAFEYSKRHGCKVINDVFKTDLISEKFDLVILNHVLEHVNEAPKMIENIKTILNTDSLLLISSPNDFNPLQVFLQKERDFNPYWIAPSLNDQPPHHINYFDFDSVEKLLKKSGFEVLEKSVSFPMELFLLIGSNYIKNEDIGKKSHNFVKKLEMNLKEYDDKVLIDLTNLFVENKIGRSFVILARLK
ncbi:MAG: class I SAM-dependent methyltransferase [Methanobrevibacter sp.]|nr:class I SAM-dependent methyltransferase [Candidatus Methanovirga aequatorialis]